MFRAILQEINSSPDLSEENLIDRIKDKLRQENHLIYYDEWQKSEFNINHTFAALNCNLLLIASENGCKKVVKYLIKSGANVNAVDHYGFTPLHSAACGGCKEVVELLLASGANVNAQDEDKETPLHYAVEHVHTKIVKLLLKNGANVDLQDIKGKTPLHYAAENGYTQIAEALLKGGAGVNVQDKEGTTPLEYAVNYSRNLKITKLLLNHGADPLCIHRPKAIIAGIAVGILAAIVVPLVLVYATALPALAIIGITAVSALIVGGIAYKVAYMESEHSLSSKLSNVSCDNVREQTTTANLPQ